MPLTIPLHLLVLVPVTAGAAGLFLPKRAYHWLLFFVNAAAVVFSISIFAEVRWGSAIDQLVAFWPAGIAIRLVADGYSAPLVLLVTVFFAGTFLFSTNADWFDKTFLFLFATLESALIGIFFSGDLFNIYVLIELTMLLTAVLIMYKQDKQAVYDAMLYLMMNFIAMAFMLLGIGYVYRITGVLDLTLLGERLLEVGEPRAMIVPYALIVTAVAVKAALFPLFSWLPRAHGAASAPPVVSAVLSGLQVKAGVYLLVRIGDLFAPMIDTAPFFMMIGFITSVVGFLLAIAQKDIKLILAYHTVSQVGLIVMGLNLGTEVAFWGGMYHIINHALFKGLLFLTAGIIIEEYGTRSYAEIRGVMRHIPAIGIGTLAGILGITGAPFFNGSISKYFIQQGLQGNLGELGLYLINFGTTLSFVKYATILFGRREAEASPSSPAVAVLAETAPSVPSSTPAPQPDATDDYAAPSAGWQDPVGAGAAGHGPVRTRSAGRDLWVNAISILFGLACLAGGVFGGPTVALFYGPQYSAAGALSLEKIGVFGLTLLIAVAVYLLVVQRIGSLLRSVQVFKFSFNQITVVLTLFFVTVIGYTWLITA